MTTMTRTMTIDGSEKQPNDDVVESDGNVV
jgi:hypothetical protein